MKNMNWQPLSNSSNKLLRDKKTFFASFSGGADSSALLLYLKLNNIAFSAVHFSHGIRCEQSGKRERLFCRGFCERHGIVLHEIALDVPAHRRAGEGIEEAARRLRIEAWTRFLAPFPNSCVLTAHHADDAAETLLLRLFRGGNVSSLAGLRYVSTVCGVEIRRPLLRAHKADLIAFLHSQGVTEWITDETNADSSYDRNFLRNEILPAIHRRIPHAQGGFDAALDALRSDADFLESASGEPEDSLAFWRSRHPALRARLMRTLLSRHFQTDTVPSKTLLERFDAALTEGGKKRIPLSGNSGFLLLDGERLSIESARPPDLTDMVWNFRQEPQIVFGEWRIAADHPACLPAVIPPSEAYFDEELLPDTLTAGIARSGEHMTLFGSPAHPKLKKIFTDAGVSSEEKKRRPVIRAGDVVLWIPELRRSDEALCSPATQRILRLRLIRPHISVFPARTEEGQSPPDVSKPHSVEWDVYRKD